MKDHLKKSRYAHSHGIQTRTRNAVLPKDPPPAAPSPDVTLPPGPRPGLERCPLPGTTASQRAPPGPLLRGPAPRPCPAPPPVPWSRAVPCGVGGAGSQRRALPALACRPDRLRPPPECAGSRSPRAASPPSGGSPSLARRRGCERPFGTGRRGGGRRCLRSARQP